MGHILHRVWPIFLFTSQNAIAMNPGTIEAATKDLKFQFLLAKCCGQAMEGTDPVTGTSATGYYWRGVLYVTEVTQKPE